MLFNTVTYAYFFSAIFVATWLLYPWPRLRLGLLLVASYVFYAGWTFVGFERLFLATGSERWHLVFESLKYVPILFIGTSLDWVLGIWLDKIDEPRGRKALLIGTIFINVGILVFFKYWNWGADTFLWLFREKFHFQVPDIHLRVDLPIGISFFCFMSLSYVIDVYRRTIPACRSYLQYLTYISFFPHLVAGPIVRGRDLLPHLERPTRLTALTGGEGLFLIATGLFKKVVIGDYLALNFVDRVFAEPTSYSALESLSAMYGYAVQVYCDFSGYSDVAIGSALLLGYRFKSNFDQPYKASNVAEFWRRWHISLSTWLRDYVYFSLGGSKLGDFRKYLNVFLTMLLCGIWHGASWTYVVFGITQGLGVALTHVVREKILPARGAVLVKRLAYAALGTGLLEVVAGALASGFGVPGILVMFRLLLVGAWLVGATLALTRRLFGDAAAWPSRVLAVAANFTFVAFSFVLFRASSIDKASVLYQRLVTRTVYTPNLPLVVVGVMLGALLLQWFPRHWGELVRERFIRSPALVQAVALLAVAFLLRKAASVEAVTFVYFQF